MSILVVSDFSEGSFRASSTRAAVAAANRIDGNVDLLIAGKGARAASDAASKLHGVTRVLAADSDSLDHLSPEILASQVLAVASNYTHIFFALGFLNRAAMPRVAAKLGVSPLTEISDVIDASTFKRAIYAGGVITTVKTSGAPVVATVRTTSFEAAADDGAASVEDLAPVEAFAKNTFRSAEIMKSDRPDLLTAKRVVAGGQGLDGEAGFKALEALADKLGAAIGATRVVVDNGLCPNEWQVGQTGKIVAPDLYIAFGISGALQHLAGMMGSKVIVAVNKDPEAPIFDVADYGLVADAASAVEELTKAL